MLKRFGDFKANVVCAVCHRHAMGVGMPVGSWGWNRPIAWVCEEPICNSVLLKVTTMAWRALDDIEADSIASAGDVAGDYLQRLGKTDLGDLSREEWLRFLKIVLTAYGDQMRARLTA